MHFSLQECNLPTAKEFLPMMSHTFQYPSVSPVSSSPTSHSATSEHTVPAPAVPRPVAPAPSATR
jgi:hypothetical protein